MTDSSANRSATDCASACHGVNTCPHNIFSGMLQPCCIADRFKEAPERASDVEWRISDENFSAGGVEAAGYDAFSRDAGFISVTR
jgi:hypothetical protein